MKTILKVLASSLLTAACVVIFLLLLVWAMDKPVYGTGTAGKPAQKNPTVYRVMT